MAEPTVQLGGDITKESEEMQSRRWKEAYEEPKEMYGEENIISVIHGDEINVWTGIGDFAKAVDQVGNLSAKDDRLLKRKCADGEILKERRGGLALNLHVWSRREHNLTA